MDKKGISVILCCYNSAGRIGKTLEALALQQCDSELPWEIIVVDNASADNTAEAATACWEGAGSAVPLRIVYEGRQGLGHARNRGIGEAIYPIVLFCDDDNWLYADYLQRVAGILDGDPAIAACGGKGIPVFETEQPEWFDEYAEAFALGSQEINGEDGRILNLYGAGLAVRKKVLDELHASGFDPLMQGRTGNTLSSSEDVELTYAFVLMGYRLCYSEELRFYHYLPSGRLTLAYLKKLFCAFGGDGPIRNLYYAHISRRFFHRRLHSWNFHLTLSLFRLVKYFILPPKKKGRGLYFHWSKAYIRTLLSIRVRYGDIRENIFRIQRIAEARAGKMG